ncbi:DUF2637 domain-containing protein [Thermobispora bispora]|uniref:DUF2637 domain-containing protein n=1 Tax=Thermobispora bispora TaxID=2006 RepID=UPI00197FC329|nr:DUF2637 domain-containing protein [Thermobispora bispora]QSI48061.1 DUF2637 domain-containing protein [Thermobispora bispora]
MRRFRSMLADSGPVLVLAVIAAVGSFDHISTLAARHGQTGWRSWSVAVCIDLMCVMAAREIQRDRRTGRPRRGLISWPSLVLAGGIVLTLAANLATARPSPWGWIVAATPAGAFLIAVSMLERRAGHTPTPARAHTAVLTDQHPCRGEPELTTRAPAELDPAEPAISPVVLDDARYLADQYARLHGTPIPAEDLARRMRISPDLADHILRRLTTDPLT